MTALPAPDTGDRPWSFVGYLDIGGGVKAEVWSREKWQVLRSVEPDPATGLPARIHVSVSHKKKTRWPTWFELVRIRDVFLGDVEAYQVIPRRSDHTNVVDNCFHLWVELL